MAVHWRHGTSMHKDAEKLADEVLSTLDKHGLIVRRAFLSTNCKDEADLEELKKKLGMEIVQFKEASFAPWQRALIDMIIASEAPLFVPSSYSSSFAKTILRCDVAIISRFSFHSILEKYPWEKRKFQREMKHKLMELGKLIDVKDDINLEQQATQCDALKQLPFFSDNSESMHEFVAELAMNTSTYWYQPGKVLLEEGDINCDEMFILLRGACEVSSCGQFLGRIENDVIGEIGILDLLERRTATVKTATACQCMKLSRQVMVPILAKYPDARLRLLELARTRLTAINEAMNGPQDGPERGTVAVQDLCGRL
ncbi:CNGA1, partial [Symbiodinium necroappetens]